MANRCKSCDIDMVNIRWNGDSFEDLCTRCKASALTEYSYTADHCWVLESQREGLTLPLSSDYDE